MSRPFNHASAPDSVTCLRGWQPRSALGRVRPEFGDKTTDSYCHELLTRLYPGRDIVQINIDPVAAGGGGIHCITLHQPT
ncbi:agmatine deiminase family protein [Aeromonas veronii]|nr:agmatine deiminase family protein [Aeromonas veronii]